MTRAAYVCVLIHFEASSIITSAGKSRSARRGDLMESGGNPDLSGDAAFDKGPEVATVVVGEI